ncbi:MinD/ParA family ATP-binding protein [Rhodococcus qingshengii]|uniref:MinD/ParA family ATP-binding protein n=1 Tax=Rhodococcus qingshengii TaxID=334542 RepID=UPI00237C7D4B|nr:ParA family protein [Rhodococcus qingshengii]WCT06207.1 ParA family protein [Rhodococcus qingshengii]
MSTPDPYETQSTYDAEIPVNLRSQRLRRQPAPDPVSVEEAEPDTAADETDTESFEEADAGYADPYEVGQDALAEIDDPEIDFRGFERDTHAIDTGPATWGWRGRVNAAAGLRMAPKPDSAEVRFRQSVTRVQQSLPGCMVVSVIGLKGDAGKTSTTLTLANTFGTHRGRGVVAWDANESTGTLGARAARTTEPELGPWDVLERAHDLTSAGAVSGELGRYLRLQPTHDEVLAADNSSSVERGIGWDECAAIMAVLRRHRDLIFIDTGNEPVAASWRWAVQHSNLLVIPLPLRRDTALLSLEMLDTITASGFGHLVRSAFILTVMTPGSDAKLEAELVERLGKRGVPASNVIRVPYEPAFTSGERILYDRLLPSTIEAYTNVAAEIADALAASVYGRAPEYVEPYIPEHFHRPDPPRIAAPPRRSPYRDTDPERYREPIQHTPPKGRLK